jgi:hypothetical protein
MHYTGVRRDAPSHCTKIVVCKGQRQQQQSNKPLQQARVLQFSSCTTSQAPLASQYLLA